MIFAEQNEDSRKLPGYIYFAVVLIVGLFLRFYLLGQAPLNNSEAELAFQALNSAKGNDTVIGGHSGYVALTTLLFYVFEGNDFLARFWPALFGSLLIFTPLLFLNKIGKNAAYFLALFIALDPSLISLSRQADGTMIAVACLLFAIGLFVNQKPIIAGVCAGLAVISSPNVWPFLVALCISWMINKTNTHPETGDSDLNSTEEPAPAPQKNQWKVGLIAGGITSILISSQLMVHPNGISGIGSGLAEFFNSWKQTGEMGFIDFLLFYLFSELPVLAVGIWGFVRGFTQKSPAACFLLLWWGIGMLLAIVNPSRSTEMIACVNIPLLIIAAEQAAYLVQKIKFQKLAVGLVQIAATITLICFSLLNLVNLINFSENNPEIIQTRMIGTLLPLALLIVITLLLAWGWEVESTKHGLVAGLLILFSVYYVGTSWKSAGLGSRPEYEISGGNQHVVGKTELMQSVTDLSRWNTGVANKIDINLAGVDSPSLLWALRDFENISSDPAFPKNSMPSIVVSGVDVNVQSQTVYRGQLLTWSTKPDLNQMRFVDWFEWSFYRTSPKVSMDYILWARNDLFKSAGE